jgi:adenine-specific DNA-methyltransferase
MANEIQELLNEIRDPRLKERLSAAVGQLRKTKKFGLVFEEHLPELLPIYSAKIRSHARVARKDGRLTETFIVERVAKHIATVKPEQGEGELQNIPVMELVVVKRFGEAIFPALRHVDSALHGGSDAPHHTLIEADNYHALQLLNWLYAGKVDCIYIDPPYNTGARDWKYNNDYVDKADGWRHSKWLSFMQRRLCIAENLLKPNGVLIVTIDEHEVGHLSVLLEQMFPQARRQMVTIVNNGAGVSQGGFYRVEEYAFFCFLGEAKPVPGDDDFLSDFGGEQTSQYWFSLIRYGGINALPSKRANLVYPIAIDEKDFRIVGIGRSLKTRVEAGDVPAATNDWLPGTETIKGHPVIWPFRGNGSMATWQVNEETLLDLYKQGFVRIRKQKKGPGGNKFSISYVKSGHREKVAQGIIPVLGNEFDHGPLVLGQIPRKVIAKTVWKRAKHDAGKWGSRMLRELLGDVSFNYAKSPYAVLDTLRTALGRNPDALILDFFAGSGTTAHATALLNAEDGGRRRCILVTNNGVSDEDEKRLREAGHSPGDREWEANGICQSITFPRCKVAITGQRPGTVLAGDYGTGRLEEKEIPRSIRSLDFATIDTLLQRRAREALAHAVGFTKSKVTGEELFFLSEGEQVAVLLDPDGLDEFTEQGQEWSQTITTVYLPFPVGKAFNSAKAQIIEAWPPLIKNVEAKRPIKEGFAANLDYFRLDFLDRA